jgi:5-methylcytosine-specific restriction endonuclease McrA
MDVALQHEVWERAGYACEYCWMPQRLSTLPFQIDHIIAVKHHGLTASENLALSCYACNKHKSANVAGVDLNTGAVTPLFHPRQDTWDDHFRWNGPELVGRTPVGTVTIDVLNINLRCG